MCHLWRVEGMLSLLPTIIAMIGLCVAMLPLAGSLHRLHGQWVVWLSILLLWVIGLPVLSRGMYQGCQYIGLYRWSRSTVDRVFGGALGAILGAVLIVLGLVVCDVPQGTSYVAEGLGGVVSAVKLGYVPTMLRQRFVDMMTALSVMPKRFEVQRREGLLEAMTDQQLYQQQSDAASDRDSNKETESMCKVYLRSGGVVTGRLADLSPERVVVSQSGGIVLILSRSDVTSIEETLHSEGLDQL